MESIVIAVGLAPSQDPDNQHENDDNLYLTSLEPSNTTVAQFTKDMVENKCRDVWLPKIASRVDNHKSSAVPVELVYGDGYRTIVRRRGAVWTKTKSITCGICIVAPSDTSPDRVALAPQILPGDCIYNHII